MASNDYHFVTHWRVEGTREEVADLLFNAEGLVDWWPSVYLSMERLKAPGPDGTGGVVALYTKGWLPYTLRWQFEVTSADYPNTLTIAATGDFNGEGRWTITQDGPWIDVTYDWRIRADKPLLKYLSWLTKPIFSANHHWAMRKGEESLKLELARRRAQTNEQRALIPPPLQPTATPSPLLGLVLIGVLAGILFARRRRTEGFGRTGPMIQSGRPQA